MLSIPSGQPSFLHTDSPAPLVVPSAHAWHTAPPPCAAKCPGEHWWHEAQGQLPPAHALVLPSGPADPAAHGTPSHAVRTPAWPACVPLGHAVQALHRHLLVLLQAAVLRPKWFTKLSESVSAEPGTPIAMTQPAGYTGPLAMPAVTAGGNSVRKLAVASAHSKLSPIG